MWKSSFAQVEQIPALETQFRVLKYSYNHGFHRIYLYSHMIVCPPCFMHVNDTSKRLVISLFWNIRRRREGGSYDKLPKRGKSTPYCQDVVSAGEKLTFFFVPGLLMPCLPIVMTKLFWKWVVYGVPESTLECILVCYFPDHYVFLRSSKQIC